MAALEYRPFTMAELRIRFEEYRKSIVKEKSLALSTAGDSVDRILNPSDRKDWQKICYYPRMNESVKEEFRKNKRWAPLMKLATGGKHGSGNVVGQHWDRELSKNIEEIKQRNLAHDSQSHHHQHALDSLSLPLQSPLSQMQMQTTEEAATLVIREIFNLFGIKFLDSHFTLYGYMYSKTEVTEESPKVYLWNGEADAVGWYWDHHGGCRRYVIVDWKVLDILDFWKKNKDAYGKYLHQCLVYARLLQLHLKLDYLPHILIVPISGTTGQDIHPALFFDYPEKCKEMIESFEWSTTLPEPPPRVVKIDRNKPWPFNNDNVQRFCMMDNTVDQDMFLSDFFDKNARVRDLFEVLGRYSFKVI